MITNQITVLPENRIIVRTPAVWHMVTIRWLHEQRQFSKNPVFEKAYKIAKEEYDNKYDE